MSKQDDLLEYQFWTDQLSRIRFHTNDDLRKAKKGRPGYTDSDRKRHFRALLGDNAALADKVDRIRRRISVIERRVMSDD